jgi:two-component system, OmpR family, alkaline phosphatase synthesis response regulator PhoP
MREKPLVLLVDDEPNFLEIMSIKLGASGFEPVVAHNAEEAMEAAKKLQPDLVLMDVHMPGATGTDAALSIKQNPETKNIKIAFLSSLKDPWPRTQASRDGITKEIGVEDFIDKSDDLDKIVTQVRQLLSRSSQ